MIAKVDGNIVKGSVVIVINGLCKSISTTEEFNQPYESIFNADKNYSDGQDIEYLVPEVSQIVDTEYNNIRKLLKIQPHLKSEDKKKVMSLISSKVKSISQEATC